MDSKLELTPLTICSIRFDSMVKVIQFSNGDKLGEFDPIILIIVMFSYHHLSPFLPRYITSWHLIHVLSLFSFKVIALLSTTFS